MYKAIREEVNKLVLKPIVKLILKVITYSSTLLTLFYVLNLYVDLFIFTGNNSPDDGYNLFALIIFVPFPLIISLVINSIIQRSEGNNTPLTTSMQKFFPLACVILVPGQFLLISFIPIVIASVMSIAITLVLFILGIYLFLKDLKD